MDIQNLPIDIHGVSMDTHGLSDIILFKPSRCIQFERDESENCPVSLTKTARAHKGRVVGLFPTVLHHYFSKQCHAMIHTEQTIHNRETQRSQWQLQTKCVCWASGLFGHTLLWTLCLACASCSMTALSGCTFSALGLPVLASVTTSYKTRVPR